MKTQEFDQLEAVVLELMAQIGAARETYLKENWLTDVMYKQVFLEKVKGLKKGIDEAIKAALL